MFPDLMKFTEPEKLRKLMANARRLTHDDYAFECQLRIAELAGLPFKGIEREFWTAVSCGEEIKAEATGKITGQSQARQKYKRQGVIKSLTALAMDAKPSEGFQVLVDHGRAELTSEAVVIRHADQFPAEAVASAAAKLEAHGISRETVA